MNEAPQQCISKRVCPLLSLFITFSQTTKSWKGFTMRLSVLRRGVFANLAVASKTLAHDCLVEFAPVGNARATIQTRSRAARGFYATQTRLVLDLTLMLKPSFPCDGRRPDSNTHKLGVSERAWAAMGGRGWRAGLAWRAGVRGVSVPR